MNFRRKPTTARFCLWPWTSVLYDRATFVDTRTQVEISLNVTNFNQIFTFLTQFLKFILSFYQISILNAMTCRWMQCKYKSQLTAYCTKFCTSGIYSYLLYQSLDGIPEPQSIYMHNFIHSTLYRYGVGRSVPVSNSSNNLLHGTVLIFFNQYLTHSISAQFLNSIILLPISSWPICSTWSNNNITVASAQLIKFYPSSLK